MIGDIGESAGIIWGFLNQQTEPINLSTLRKGVNLPDMLLMMGLGWLAREDKLNIEKLEASYKISIKRDV